MESEKCRLLLRERDPVREGTRLPRRLAVLGCPRQRWRFEGRLHSLYCYGRGHSLEVLVEG